MFLSILSFTIMTRRGSKFCICSSDIFLILGFHLIGHQRQPLLYFPISPVPVFSPIIFCCYASLMCIHLDQQSRQYSFSTCSGTGSVCFFHTILNIESLTKEIDADQCVTVRFFIFTTLIRSCIQVVYALTIDHFRSSCQPPIQCPTDRKGLM